MKAVSRLQASLVQAAIALPTPGLDPDPKATLTRVLSELGWKHTEVRLSNYARIGVVGTVVRGVPIEKLKADLKKNLEKPYDDSFGEYVAISGQGHSEEGGTRFHDYYTILLVPEPGNEIMVIMLPRHKFLAVKPR